MSLNESIVEDAALEWFGELGCAVGHGFPRMSRIECMRNMRYPRAGI